MGYPEKYPAKYPQLNEMEFTDTARRILIRILQVAFPHEGFPDGPYERQADQIFELANESTWFRIKLTQGLATLNDLAGGSFLSLDNEAATKVLKHVEHTDFFGFIRRTTILNMYEDEAVWEVLGYEGPSFDKGGYVDRGFNDLDWLPDPRVEESGEEFVEIVSDLPTPSHAAPGEDQPTGAAAQASHPGVAPMTADQNLTEDN